MVSTLLDTGALFAILCQGHSSHARTSRWLAGADQYATCGLTQIGAFRLLLTEAAMQGSPLNPATAHEVLAEFTAGPRHLFVPCPAPGKKFVGQTTGNQAAFDDYLVQIASDADLKLATLDTRLSTRWPKQTLIIR